MELKAQINNRKLFSCTDSSYNRESLLSLSAILRQIDSMSRCVCLVIDQNVVRTTKVAHEAIAERVTVTVSYFHRLLQRVMPYSQHSNKLSIVPHD